MIKEKESEEEKIMKHRLELQDAHRRSVLLRYELIKHTQTYFRHKKGLIHS